MAAVTTAFHPPSLPATEGWTAYAAQQRECTQCHFHQTRMLGTFDYVWVRKTPAPAQEASGPESTGEQDA